MWCWARGHDYVEHERFYTAARSYGDTIFENDRELARAGFTTLILRCTRCGKLKQYRVSGRAMLGRPQDEVERLIKARS